MRLFHGLVVTSTLVAGLRSTLVRLRMSQVTQTVSQEYWRPSNSAAARLLKAPMGEPCPSCGVDYYPAAQFCHCCGHEREQQTRTQNLALADYFDLSVLRRRLGLSPICMLCLIAGAVCIAIAAMLGMLYKAQTSLEWQALQMWRIEWLWGAAGVLLAGILLKNKNA